MALLTVGHRGLMGVEPENTLRSFARAQAEGVDVVGANFTPETVTLNAGGA